MHFSTLVIEDFYDKPDEIREMALAQDYPEPETKPNYPGRNSARPLLVSGLDDIISDIVNEKVVASKYDSHGYFRQSMAADDVHRKYYVHTDATVYWSGILYLSKPEYCQGGTDLFRHIETGTDRAPIHEEELKAHGGKTWWEVSDKIIAADSNDLSKWEHIMRVPARFNRLVLIRPWLWHTAGPSFGDNPENCRLVQLFFWRRAD